MTTRLRQQDTQGRWGLIGMTTLTLALLGGVVLWQGRQDDVAHPAPIARSATSTSAQDGPARGGGLAERAPVSDQEMYRNWQQRSALDSGAVATTGVSDQEMYSRVRARTTDEEADQAAVSDQEMYQRLSLASLASDLP
jgi:hypothetical protein